MDVQLETVSQVRRRLSFTLSASTVAAAFVATTQRFAAKTRVPGFRPGKAPAAMIERMHGTEIRRSVLDKLLQDNVFKAITAAGVHAVSRPEIESVGELRRDLELPITFSIEVMPELHPTGYEGATLSTAIVVADDADLEEALETKCRERAEYVPVEGGMEPGDEVTVDYALVPLGESAGTPVRAEKRRFTVGSGHVPAPVDDAVRGAKPEATIERTVTLTEDGHGLQAGTEVALSVVVHEGQRLIVPKLDDAFAVDVGETDLAALRAKVQADLAAQADKKTLELKRRAAVNHLLSVNPVEVPRAVVEHYADEQLSGMFGNLSQQQMRQLAGPLQQLRARMAGQAEVALRRSLLIQAFAADKGLEVDDAEIEARIEVLAAEDADHAVAIRQRYASEEGRDGLKGGIRADKASDLLVAAATFAVSGQQSLRQAQASQASAELEDVAPPAAHVHGPDCDHDHDHDDDAQGAILPEHAIL